MFAEIGAIILLTVCGIFDLKWKKIPVWAFVAGGVWAIICFFLRCFGEGDFAQSVVWQEIGGAAAAVLPGVIFLILSFLTEKKVGYGDGLLLIILGLMEGMKAVAFTCCMGLFLQSLVAVFLVIFKKANKQTEIPFVPFLFLARIILVFL